MTEKRIKRNVPHSKLPLKKGSKLYVCIKHDWTTWVYAADQKRSFDYWSKQDVRVAFEVVVSRVKRSGKKINDYR